MGGQTVEGLVSMSRQLEVLITGGGPTSQTNAFALSNNTAPASAVALNAVRRGCIASTMHANHFLSYGC
jgi:hypothetical protein